MLHRPAHIHAVRVGPQSRFRANLRNGIPLARLVDVQPVADRQDIVATAPQGHDLRPQLHGKFCDLGRAALHWSEPHRHNHGQPARIIRVQYQAGFLRQLQFRCISLDHVERIHEIGSVKAEGKRFSVERDSHFL
jgi:hypothetical protein